MKILFNNTVYLQKYEVAYITHEIESVPCSIMEEIFAKKEAFIMSGIADGLNFEYAFRRPESVEWLMAQDEIIDYDKYIQMPLSKLKKLHRKLKRKHRKEIHDFNRQDDYARRSQYEAKSREFNKQGHKISSLGCLIKARKGRIKFILPSECQAEDKPHASTYFVLPREHQAEDKSRTSISAPAHYKK